MPTKISHIVIPVKNKEEIYKARDFFVNVIGLHAIRDTATFPGGKVPIVTELDLRLPDHAVHLADDYGTFIDIVAYDDRPVSYAQDIGSGKGIAFGFQVEDIKKTWASLKDYPVRPIYEPMGYPDDGSFMDKEEGSYAFFALDMNRVSDDGKEQILEINQWKQKGSQ